MDAELIGTKVFNAELVLEGTWGSRDLGKHESTMRLYFNKDASGFIEWEIPALDEFETIGLGFDLDRKGKRTLNDYDGVFSLPKEAIALLRKNGVVVPLEFTA